MQKIEINKNKPLQPGDLIEMHFKTIGGTWLRYSHIALIEYNLEGRKDFKIVSSSLPDDHTMVLEIRIKKTNPVILTPIIIGAIIIGIGIVAWLSLSKVYQIMESPAGQVGIAGFGIMAAVAAIAILIVLLSKK